jgi:hypothetical protein
MDNKAMELLIDGLPNFSSDNAKRQAVKTLAEERIPEDLEGKLVDLCFNWIQSADMQVSIKVHCMQIIANISQKHPALASELKAVLIEYIPRNSAGFAARARNIFKELK